MVGVIFPDPGKEIIKGAHTGGVTEGKAAKNSIKGSFPEHAAPDSDRSHFQFQSKQVGAQHTGRKVGLWAKNGVAFLQNGIRLGKIKVLELHDIVPGAFRRHKGIRIKFKELGYESILIGGMAAGITRSIEIKYNQLSSSQIFSDLSSVFVKKVGGFFEIGV